MATTGQPGGWPQLASSSSSAAVRVFPVGNWRSLFQCHPPSCWRCCSVLASSSIPTGDRMNGGRSPTTVSPTTRSPRSALTSSRARAARASTSLTLDAVVDGSVGMEDLRITPAALRLQADIASAAGRPTLGQNFERAAELVNVPQDEVMAIYELLRPGRAQIEGRPAGRRRQPARNLWRDADGRIHRRGRRGLRAAWLVREAILKPPDPRPQIFRAVACAGQPTGVRLAQPRKSPGW